MVKIAPKVTTTEEPKKTLSQYKRENESLKAKIEKLQSSAFCYMCNSTKHRDLFYVSTDPRIKSGITPICKECARKIALKVGKDGIEHPPTKESVRLALRYLNKPYLESLWDSSVQESENLAAGKTKSNVWTSYIKNVAMGNYNGMTYWDSDFVKEDFIDEETETEIVNEVEAIELDKMDLYLKNKKDVVKLLDYDPFEEEALSDQPFLYAQLIGLLDAGGDSNDDMVRNASCIAIVRGFLQHSKIDNAIANLMGDILNIEKNSATIKSLQDSKAKITSIISTLAAESCISLKNNKNSKRGDNTWTGKIKKIKDLDLREGRVNGFDMETAKAMRQVMDSSHHSIIQELKLDESDWSDMVAEQREMIVKLQRDLDTYTEISRILLSENLDLKDFLESKNIKPDGYNYVNLEELFSRFSCEDENLEKEESSDEAQ